MRYLSVCSGIEAATVAWGPLGFTPEAFAEIDKFSCAVLNHHYPNVPNLGDINEYEQWRTGAIDLLVGGTPCQSFSVAGKRAGMDDHRGNLTWTYLEIVARLRPRWLVWENVPGVLSIDSGATFGAILGRLGQLGYGFAYRVLDAKHYGVPQSRRRVFVVGYLGDWRAPAAVLFDRESLRGNPPKGTKAKSAIADALTIHHGRNDGESTYVAHTLTSRADSNGKGGYAGRGYVDELNLVAHCLRGEGFDASEDGTGRGSPLVAFEKNQRAEIRERDVIGSLSSIRRGDARNETLLAFSNRQDPNVRDVAPCCEAKGNGNAIMNGSQVRRLTATEWARLQGFPDSYLELRYADADEAHSAQILHELWKEARTPTIEKQERARILASLLTPEILLTGVHVGWVSWEMAANSADRSRALSGAHNYTDRFVRLLRAAQKAGYSPYRRQSFKQLARELGSAMSELPYEETQAREIVRDSGMWEEAQRAWPLRYAFATEAQRRSSRPLNTDSPRYRAIGNSMAVPIMRRIGERIKVVSEIINVRR